MKNSATMFRAIAHSVIRSSSSSAYADDRPTATVGTTSISVINEKPPFSSDGLNLLANSCNGNRSAEDISPKNRPVCVRQFSLGCPYKSVGDVGGVCIQTHDHTARVYTCCFSENGPREVERRVRAIEQKTMSDG